MRHALAAAILRRFIRYGIPPLPSDYVTRQRRYLRELAEVCEKGSIPQGRAGALRANEIRQHADLLREEFVHDAELIFQDPYSYRFWNPSEEDWRSLAIAQMIDRDPKQDPQLQLPEINESARGDRVWVRTVYAEKARLELAERDGCLPTNVRQKDSAELTAQKIQAAAKDGTWEYPVPKTSTVEEAWNDMRLDEIVGEIPKIGDLIMRPRLGGERLAVPSNIRVHRKIADHVAEVQAAAETLGWGSRGPVVFPDFRAWATERVAPQYRLPDAVAEWRDYDDYLKETASAKAKTTYETLFSEYSALRS